MRHSTKQRIVAAALTGLMLAAPATASAEKNPYHGQQVCGGSSYGLYRDYTLWSNDRKVRMGRLQVWYSAWHGKTCGVLFKARRVGQPTYTSVSIAAQPERRRQKLRWKSDGDPYRYYAGPVYAPGPCARVGGFMHFPNGREGLFVEGAFPPGC